MRKVLAFVLLLFFVVASFFFYSQKNKKILSASVASPIASPQPFASAPPSPTPSPTPSPLVKLSKSTYVIAAFGDSMVDTMGENLDYLDQALRAKYPRTFFKMYNYGIGSQNVAEGLSRVNNNLTYKERNFEPITKINADVIVLGSFSYNTFPSHDRSRHYSTLIELVNKMKETGASVYLLAEIAPLSSGFGKGEHGVNWPEVDAHAQAQKIVEQIEDTISVTNNLGVPLINAYSLSTVDGRFGNSSYVDGNDGIHPSVAGHVLMANTIARTIKLK